MIEATRALDCFIRKGFTLWSGVPCSYLTPFIDAASASSDISYVPAANEGDAVAVAAGAETGGQHAVAMMQNSGLGNAVNPLTSLTHTFEIPVLLIITHRGDPGGEKDEPQHELMGAITTPMLDMMQIPWSPFPDNEEDLDRVLSDVLDVMHIRKKSYALVMKKGVIRAFDNSGKLPVLGSGTLTLSDGLTPRHTRYEVLECIRNISGARDILVATTGYTGRELFSLGDHPNQIYMVGSMGCAASLGLGLALARPEFRVIVVDGDGALLMRMGALSAVAQKAPRNLLHIALDNHCHESTGGQAALSVNSNLAEIAHACGYPLSVQIDSVNELSDFIANQKDSLAFVHMPTRAGTAQPLPRPDITPAQVARRLKEYLLAEIQG